MKVYFMTDPNSYITQQTDRSSKVWANCGKVLAATAKYTYRHADLVRCLTGKKGRNKNMLTVKSANVRDNFEEWCDKINMDETVVISRPRNENIYMINKAEYNTLQRAKRNAEYLAMLDVSDNDLKTGKVVVKTMEELEAMEN